MQSDNPPNALLTEWQRAVLEGREENLTDAAEWKMHERIRHRFEASIYDFGLLYDNWDEIGLDQVADRECEDRHELEHALVGVIASAYRVAFPHGIFKNLLYRGVMIAEEERNNRAVSPRFFLNTDAPSIALLRLADRIEQFEGEENTPDIRIGELRLFAQALANTDIDLAKAVREGRRQMFGLDEERDIDVEELELEDRDRLPSAEERGRELLDEDE